MKITYTFPSLQFPHGGSRVVIDHLHELQRRNHDVTLFVEKGTTDYSWYGPIRTVPVTKDKTELRKADVVVIGSPHSIWYKPRSGQRVFSFMQMAEHLFRPGDKAFEQQCKLFYSLHPVIYIAKWNEQFIKHPDRYYIRNGVNFDNFPIEYPDKENVVLVEGWECSNPTKDIHGYGPMVAAKMKERFGYKVIAYGSHPLTRFKDVPDEYHVSPSLEVMNDLYRRARYLIKATVCDASSCAPMEAATKQCITIRAVNDGDDWLVDGANCRRVKYDVIDLWDAWSNGYMTVNAEVLSWSPIIDELEKIYAQ